MPEKVLFSNYKAICNVKNKTTKHNLLNIVFEHASNVNLFFFFPASNKTRNFYYMDRVNANYQ